MIVDMWLDILSLGLLVCEKCFHNIEACRQNGERRRNPGALSADGGTSRRFQGLLSVCSVAWSP